MDQADAGLAQLLINKSEYRRRDADDDERRDRTPDGVGLSELPDGKDAEDGACNERERDHCKRDPSNDRRTNHTARCGLQFYNNISIVSLHISGL